MMLDQDCQMAIYKEVHDFFEWLKSSIRLCPHGYIGTTCELCAQGYIR
jgi:hypothetical protein